MRVLILLHILCLMIKPSSNQLPNLQLSILVHFRTCIRFLIVSRSIQFYHILHDRLPKHVISSQSFFPKCTCSHLQVQDQTVRQIITSKAYEMKHQQKLIGFSMCTTTLKTAFTNYKFIFENEEKKTSSMIHQQNLHNDECYKLILKNLFKNKRFF